MPSKLSPVEKFEFMRAMIPGYTAEYALGYLLEVNRRGEEKIEG